MIEVFFTLNLGNAQAQMEKLLISFFHVTATVRSLGKLIPMYHIAINLIKEAIVTHPTFKNDSKLLLEYRCMMGR